jgi:predicted PolB exonuclease-like 3'-5' exonuclease
LSLEDIMANADKPAYLVMDTESVPDGRLLALVKYPVQNLTPEQAVERAQEEARELSATGSDFLGASFMYPVAVCVVRVGADFAIQKITSLDAPEFRPREIVCQFWDGLNKVNGKLVTYNGRGFDVPLMEMAAFRFGCNLGEFGLMLRRDRYGLAQHIDLMDWMGNFGAIRHPGGLNLLSKLLGKPGKMDVSGDKVYSLFLKGQLQLINDYCACDTLDTYFVFLRSRVLTGEITLEQERELVGRAKQFVQERVGELPGLEQYLENWGDWQPWP